MSQSAISPSFMPDNVIAKWATSKTSYKSHVTPFITTPAWRPPPALWGNGFFTPWNIHGDFTRLYVAETFAVFKVETSEFDTLNNMRWTLFLVWFFTKTWNSKEKDFSMDGNGETKTFPCKDLVRKLQVREKTIVLKFVWMDGHLVV